MVSILRIEERGGSVMLRILWKALCLYTLSVFTIGMICGYYLSN